MEEKQIRTHLSFSVYDIPDASLFGGRERESTDFHCSGKHHLSDLVVKNEQALLSKSARIFKLLN